MTSTPTNQVRPNQVRRECLGELNRMLREHSRSARREHLVRAGELLDETLALGELDTTPRGWAQQYIEGADLRSVEAPGWLRIWRRRRKWIVTVSIAASTLTIGVWRWNTAHPVRVGLNESGFGVRVEMPPTDPEFPEGGVDARLGSIVRVGYTIENSSMFSLELLGDRRAASVPTGSPWALTSVRIMPSRNNGCRRMDGCDTQFPLEIGRGERVSLRLDYEIVRCDLRGDGEADAWTQPPIGDLEYRWLGRTDVVHAAEVFFDSIPGGLPPIRFPSPGESWCDT